MCENTDLRDHIRKGEFTDPARPDRYLTYRQPTRQTGKNVPRWPMHNSKRISQDGPRAISQHKFGASKKRSKGRATRLHPEEMRKKEQKGRGTMMCICVCKTSVWQFGGKKQRTSCVEQSSVDKDCITLSCMSRLSPMVIFPAADCEG